MPRATRSAARHPHTGRHVRGAVVAVAAALALTACSTPVDFWSAGPILGHEAYLPANTKELVDRAEVIVVGTITEAKPGPESLSGSSDKDAPVLETVDLVIDVETVLKGSPGESLTVSMASQNVGARVLDDAEGQRLLWFLEEEKDLGLYITASSRGAWGVDDGAVVTLRDPVATAEVVPAGVTSIDAAAAAVAALVTG